MRCHDRIDCSTYLAGSENIGKVVAPLTKRRIHRTRLPKLTSANNIVPITDRGGLDSVKIEWLPTALSVHGNSSSAFRDAIRESFVLHASPETDLRADQPSILKEWLPEGNHAQSQERESCAVKAQEGLILQPWPNLWQYRPMLDIHFGQQDSEADPDLAQKNADDPGNEPLSEPEFRWIAGSSGTHPGHPMH